MKKIIIVLLFCFPAFGVLAQGQEFFIVWEHKHLPTYSFIINKDTATLSLLLPIKTNSLPVNVVGSEKPIEELKQKGFLIKKENEKTDTVWLQATKSATSLSVKSPKQPRLLSLRQEPAIGFKLSGTINEQTTNIEHDDKAGQWYLQLPDGKEILVANINQSWIDGKLVGKYKVSLTNSREPLSFVQKGQIKYLMAAGLLGWQLIPKYRKWQATKR